MRVSNKLLREAAGGERQGLVECDCAKVAAQSGGAVWCWLYFELESKS